MCIRDRLSNDTGRLILEKIRQGCKTISEIARETGLPMSTVSFHVNRLVEAGVLKVERNVPGKRGRMNVYQMPRAILIVLSGTEDISEFLKPAYRDFLRILEKSVKSTRNLMFIILLAVILASPIAIYNIKNRGVPMPYAARKTLSEEGVRRENISGINVTEKAVKTPFGAARGVKTVIPLYVFIYVVLAVLITYTSTVFILKRSITKKVEKRTT